MELMARVQKILGKKIFQDAIIARNGMEVYATPKANEPSLGTLHPYTVDDGGAWKYSNTGPAAGTWYTVTFSECPTGTKAVLIVTARVNGSGNVYGRKYGTSFTQGPRTRLTGSNGAGLTVNQALVCCDGSNRIEVSTDDANTDIYISTPVTYSI